MLPMNFSKLQYTEEQIMQKEFYKKITIQLYSFKFKR